MAQSIIQHSFHAGEWAPQLNARVDLQKYHSAAALMRNFYVDYRGGASTRPGTKYILQAYKSATPVRLISFAASSTVQYVLEFGQNYLRFHYHGAPVLEAGTTITGATQANPCVITDVAHGYATGDWVYITDVVGMTQLNGKYYSITKLGADTYSLQKILDGTNVDSTTFTAYGSAGTAQRVYTLTTSYMAADLALIKFVQSVNTMILCHPSYPTQVLTLVTAANWNIVNVTIGTTLQSPTNIAITSTYAAGAQNFNYAITAVDINGQESLPTFKAITLLSNPVVNQGTNHITWTGVNGAQFYNVYAAQFTTTAISNSWAYGFIGYTYGTSYEDSSPYGPDFAVTVPINQNPFAGGPVASVTQNTGGVYAPSAAIPAVTIAAPSNGIQAQAVATMRNNSIALVGAGTAYQVGDLIGDTSGLGCVIVVTALGGAGAIATASLVNRGSITGPGTIPANPLTFSNPHGGGQATFNLLTWAVDSTTVTNGGTGYSSAAIPAVTYSGGGPAATGTAVVTATAAGNPGVPAFYQQRLVLAASMVGPQTFFMSQPGLPFNFNISNPTQPDDAITGSIVSTTLNTIKSMVPMPNGLIVLSDRQAWIVNGGSAGAAITPIDAQAQAQAYNGASDVPPIVVNYDILYVQAKGSIVRDLTYNFYTNIYTGTDITVLSSHLFFGYSIKEWAYAEEPFKIVWVVRNEGTLLSLTFVKEQELIGWAHHDTNGTFQSVASIVEPITTPAGYSINVDALYMVVRRTINSQTVQYIERMADRFFNGQVKNAWCVDAALQYNSTPATVFSGLDHLVGATVTGLADGKVIPPTTVSASGTVTLATSASLVTIGLAYTPQLQTLRLDTGEPTIQGKRKQIPAVTVRVQDTLGLSIGRTTLGAFGTALVPMKDLVVGNVGTMSNQVVTDLVTDDARTIIDPLWDVPGEYCIQQSNPFPATILGVIPEIIVENAK